MGIRLTVQGIVPPQALNRYHDWLTDGLDRMLGVDETPKELARLRSFMVAAGMWEPRWGGHSGMGKKRRSRK